MTQLFAARGLAPHHAGLLVLVVLAATAFEAFALERSGKRYAWREVATSVGVAAVGRVASFVSALALAPLFADLWTARFATLSFPDPYRTIVAFLLVEFAYYWMHRASHTVKWMWATHSVHHSAEQLNLPAAVRIGGSGALSLEWLPFVPLVLLGVTPAAIATLLGANLAYQFFLHTQLIPRLGPLEWILNTPSAHRVHHATNRRYLDKNFGGVLVIFDRLFGTYEAEDPSDVPVYGLRGERRGTNPFWVIAAGWVRLFNSYVARAKA